MLATANEWTQNGIAVIPCWYKQKTPRLDNWREYQRRLPHPTELRQWFSRPTVNLAVVTGWQSLAVVDFDDMDKYREWHFWAKQTGGEPLTVAEITRRALTAKGVHLYVTSAGPERNRKFAGGDIRAAGGYVIAPPSIHPSGKQYRWLYPTAPIIRVTSIAAILPTDWLATYDPAPLPVDTEPTRALSVWDIVNSTPAALSISEVRARVSLLSLMPEAEQSSPDGRWWKAPCPFHEDSHPSFWIDTARGLCGCHSCGMKPMDVVNLYARLHMVDNTTAFRELAAEVGH